MNDDYDFSGDYLSEYVDAGECPECAGDLEEEPKGHVCSDCGFTVTEDSSSEPADSYWDSY
jgi:predicted amidophosphoribosyltransferase